MLNSFPQKKDSKIKKLDFLTNKLSKHFSVYPSRQKTLSSMVLGLLCSRNVLWFFHLNKWSSISFNILRDLEYFLQNRTNYLLSVLTNKHIFLEKCRFSKSILGVYPKVFLNFFNFKILLFSWRAREESNS